MYKRVSVLIPTFNGSEYLQPQFDSIENQIDEIDELIISDDCSKDDTLEITKSFKLKHPQKIKVHQNGKRLGLAKNLAKCLYLCKGDYIFLSDQDDIWCKDRIKKTLAIFDENQSVDLVFSDLNILKNSAIIDDTLFDQIAIDKKQLQTLLDNDPMRLLIGPVNFIYGNTIAFRRNYIDEFSKCIDACSDNFLYHDLILALLVILKKKSIFFHKEPLVNYRVHDQQLSGRVDKTKSTLSRQYFYNKSNALLKLHEYLTEYYEHSDDLKMLCQKSGHLAHRSEVSKMRFTSRLNNSLKELVNGRYDLFSNGFKSFMRDLFTL